jgi:hypothetical protein
MSGNQEVPFLDLVGLHEENASAFSTDVSRVEPGAAGSRS